MEASELVVLLTLGLAWTLAARRMTSVNVTAPMAFGLAGVVLAEPIGVDLSAEQILPLAELTLVVILFHDASTVRLAELRRDPGIAGRLLLIGFPLALIFTFLVGWGMLPALGVAGAWLLAGALTPTDAGLGAATILNPSVPVRVRRALNVESGLNDGLATPVVLLALAALVAEGGEHVSGGAASLVNVGVVPVLLGVGLGIALGVVGALLLDASRHAGWSTTHSRAVAVAILPILALGVSEFGDANSFITAFVAGIAFGRVSKCVAEEPEVNDTAEIVSDVLGYVVWFLAGALTVRVFIDGVEWQWVVIAIAALTVLRVLPVYLALLGTGFRLPTVLFIGWFGPRGLASVVFALIALEELGPQNPVYQEVAGTIAITVTISVIAHGISASPLAKRYGRWATQTQAPIEMEPGVEPVPSRGRLR